MFLTEKGVGRAEVTEASRAESGSMALLPAPGHTYIGPGRGTDGGGRVILHNRRTSHTASEHHVYSPG